LTLFVGKRTEHMWRFVTGLRATLNIPLKGQDEASLRLTMRSGAFSWPAHFRPQRDIVEKYDDK
jgi:hypothetical protein